MFHVLISLLFNFMSKVFIYMICYPGAFNMSTGELLWELEQRSPARASSCSYMIWGHSTLVGPSGEIIATSGDQETVVVGEIDYSKIQQQRKSLPLNEQKRREIYQFVDVHEQEQETD
ncbi:omega-amidase, chloroplastic-like [Cannabis sativa]|uniref:omega-amidase, chloroplastic-like n=1 Tax=Cannabis sativa TaxID=3483 RepID=UPI0029C9F224|nr:omega-amidase, chloroplastic-like [Cannabis sativa]